MIILDILIFIIILYFIHWYYTDVLYILIRNLSMCVLGFHCDLYGYSYTVHTD